MEEFKQVVLHETPVWKSETANYLAFSATTFLRTMMLWKIDTSLVFIDIQKLVTFDWVSDRRNRACHFR